MADGIGWDEAVPADTESAGLGDDRIRSLKTSLRQGLNDEHNWPSAGGNGVGYHKYGSARPYHGTQSAVSSSGTDGKLMMTSDTSRLFGVGSGGTTFIGGPTVISAGSTPGGSYPQRHHWVEEFGEGITSSSGSTTVTIPNSGYSGAPYVWCSHYTGTVAATPIMFSVTQVSASQVIVTTGSGSGVYAANIPFWWRSIGTRVL